MNKPTLEALLLTADELEAAKKKVKEMAYHMWQAAGSPDGRSNDFWKAAERHWIEYLYVPNRRDGSSDGILG